MNSLCNSTNRKDSKPAHDASVTEQRKGQHGVVECLTTIARFQSPTPATPAVAPNSAQFQTKSSKMFRTETVRNK